MRGLAAVTALLALTLVGWQARGQNLTGSATLDYRRTTSDRSGIESSSSAFSQDYFATLTQELSPTVGYRFNIRIRDERSGLESGATSSKSSTLNMEPSGEAFLRDPFYDLVLGYRYRENFLKSSNQDQQRLTSLDGYSRLNWRPEGLPQVAVRVERDSSLDNLGRTDAVDSRIFLGTDYAYKFLTMQYNLTGNFSQDQVGKTERESLENLANLSFNRSFFLDRLTASGALQYNTRTETSIRTGAEQEDSTSIWNGSLNFNSRPFERANITYALFFANLTKEPAATRDLFTSNGLNFSYNFRENLLGTTSFNHTTFNTTTPGAFSTSSDTLSFSVLHQPLKTLSATYSFSHGIQRQEGTTLTVSDAGLASFSGQVYRDLRAVLDLSLQRSTAFDTDTKSLVAQARGNVTAQFTRKLSGNLTGTLSWQRSTSPVILSSEVGTSGSAFLLYRASPILDIRSNFNFSRQGGEGQFSQGVAVDWIPFPAITSFLSFDQQFPSQGGSKQSVASQVRWNLARDMYLQFSLSAELAQAGRTQDVALSYNIRF